MEQYLYKYLMLYGHLGIPDIGNFHITRHPATLNQEGSTVFPPREEIVFSASSVKTEKQLFEFIALEAEMDQVTAIQAFHSFVGVLRNQLKKDTSVYLKGIGQITATSSPLHPYSLIPDTIESYASAVYLKNNEVVEEVLPAEDSTTDINFEAQWEPYALALFIAGVLLIILKYYL